MPQITIEFSENLRSRTDMRQLARIVHESARNTGLFDKGYGIRTRLDSKSEYVVADGDPENAFVEVRLRIAHGRSESQRQMLADAVFAVVCEHLAELSGSSPLAISLEVQEINPVGALNHNNLHARLAVKYGEARGGG